MVTCSASGIGPSASRSLASAALRTSWTSRCLTTGGSTPRLTSKPASCSGASAAGISAANAGSLQRAAQLYVPGSYRSLFSGNSDWLAFGTYEGIYLVDLPSLQMRRFIPQSTGWDAVFGASADARWFAWVAETGVVKGWG